MLWRAIRVLHNPIRGEGEGLNVVAYHSFMGRPRPDYAFGNRSYQNTTPLRVSFAALDGHDGFYRSTV